MNRQKREQQILKAALKVFARQGYPKTNVSDLVKEAGVSRGTFYLYFKSKKDIFARLVDRFMGEVLDCVSQFEPGHAGRDSLAEVCHDLAVCLARYRLLARLLIRDMRSLERAQCAKIDGYYKQIYRVLEHNIRRTLGRDVEAGVVARCLIGTVKEYLLDWNNDDHHFELDKKLAGLIHLLFVPLRSAASPPVRATLKQGKYLDEGLVSAS